MITLEQFLDGIKKNAKRIHDYEKGHDGSDGTCDCVGLIIGALRLEGVQYKGTHGSNYFARYCTSGMRRISDLKVGDLVYKAKWPGDEGYDLPPRYEDGTDTKDYYHIGVVMSVEPLSIWHCSGGGMHYDNKFGKWNYCGECTYVSGYGEGIMMKTPYIAKVITSSDDLRLRVGPSTNYTKIGSVPKGAEVKVITHSDSWDFIEYDGMSGYASNQYLLPVREIHDDTEEEITITVPKADVLRFVNVLRELIGVLEGGK